MFWSVLSVCGFGVFVVFERLWFLRFWSLRNVEV